VGFLVVGAQVVDALEGLLVVGLAVGLTVKGAQVMGDLVVGLTVEGEFVLVAVASVEGKAAGVAVRVVVEGEAVGFAVGAVVGEDVGFAVGVIVGEAVGWTVVGKVVGLKVAGNVHCEVAPVSEFTVIVNGLVVEMLI
jgi:hypothetical protein